MARWLLPVPNSLLTFCSSLSEGAAAFDPRFQARAAALNGGSSAAMGDCPPHSAHQQFIASSPSPAKETVSQMLAL